MSSDAHVNAQQPLCRNYAITQQQKQQQYAPPARPAASSNSCHARQVTPALNLAAKTQLTAHIQQITGIDSGDRSDLLHLIHNMPTLDSSIDHAAAVPASLDHNARPGQADAGIHPADASVRRHYTTWATQAVTTSSAAAAAVYHFPQQQQLQQLSAHDMQVVSTSAVTPHLQLQLQPSVAADAAAHSRMRHNAAAAAAAGGNPAGLQNPLPSLGCSAVTHKTQMLATSLSVNRPGAAGSSLRLAGTVGRSSSGTLAESLLSEVARAEAGLLTVGLRKSGSLPNPLLLERPKAAVAAAAAVDQTSQGVAQVVFATEGIADCLKPGAELTSLDLEALALPLSLSAGLPSLSALIQQQQHLSGLNLVVPTAPDDHPAMLPAAAPPPSPPLAAPAAPGAAAVPEQQQQVPLHAGVDDHDLHMTPFLTHGVFEPAAEEHSATALTQPAAAAAAAVIPPAQVCITTAACTTTMIKPPNLIPVAIVTGEKAAAAAAAADGTADPMQHYNQQQHFVNAGGKRARLGLPQLLAPRDVLHAAADQQQQQQWQQHAAVPSTACLSSGTAVSHLLGPSNNCDQRATAFETTPGIVGWQPPLLPPPPQQQQQQPDSLDDLLQQVTQELMAEAYVKQRSALQFDTMQCTGTTPQMHALHPAAATGGGCEGRAFVSAFDGLFADNALPAAAAVQAAEDDLIMLQRPREVTTTTAAAAGDDMDCDWQPAPAAASTLSPAEARSFPTAAAAASGSSTSQQVARYARVISCKTYLKRLNITQPMAEYLLPIHNIHAPPKHSPSPTAAAAAAGWGAEVPQSPTSKTNSNYELLFKECITLIDEHGARFKVQYEGVSCNQQKHLRLTSGWRDYVRRQGIQVGDTLMFERRGNDRHSLYVSVVKSGSSMRASESDSNQQQQLLADLQGLPNKKRKVSRNKIAQRPG